MLWMQRTVGNHATTGVLLQRDPAPTPVAAGKSRAQRLAKLLPSKRADVLAELAKASEPDRQAVDDAAAALANTTKAGKGLDAILLLRRCIAFVRHRPTAATRRAPITARKGGEGKVALTAKVDGGTVEVRTGVEAGLGRPTFSLAYHGSNADDCQWLQFIWREIVTRQEAAKGGAADNAVPGRVERAAGFSYNLTTDQDAPEWNTDTADRKSAFYEKNTEAVNRDDDDLVMFDDPDPRENILTDIHRKAGTSPPAHAVSRAHFETYLVRGMDVLFRVRLDLSWQITNGKADAAPDIVPHGEVMSGIRVTQLAKLTEQLGSTAEMPDYLATVPDKKAADKRAADKNAKAQPAKKPAAKAVQRDTTPFEPVKDLSPKGSLSDSEWNVKTRTVGTTELYAEIAALAGADRIEGVTGTSKASINPILRKDSDLKTGLNFVNNLPSNGETGFIDSGGTYRGPKLPLDDTGIPTVAIMLGPSAFTHDKAQALATMRHEMKHAEHFLLTIAALKRWRDGKRKKAFAVWVGTAVKEPDRTLILERISGATPDTELIAYTEGLVTSFHFLPQTPDPKLMVAGNFPVAIFELLHAGANYQASSDEANKVALTRLRSYCRDTLSAAQRSALVAWVDYLQAYVGVKDVPAVHKDADKRNAKVIMDEVRNLGPFLKQVRGIAAKPGK